MLSPLPPNCLLQVKNPEKYGFDPKLLLGQLIDIYLHLKGEVLARAVADDQRSYNKELFDMCIRLLEKNDIKGRVCFVHVCVY